MKLHPKPIPKRRAFQLVLWQNHRVLLRFYAIFLYLVLLFYLLLHQSLGERLLTEWLPGWTADFVALLLRLAGHPAEASGVFVHVGDGASLEIIYHCLGLSLMGVYSAATLAYPTTWSKRAIGIVGGLPILFLLNAIRIAALGLISKYWPASFDWLHHYLWPDVLIVFVLLLWSLWRTHIVRDGKPLKTVL